MRSGHGRLSWQSFLIQQLALRVRLKGKKEIGHFLSMFVSRNVQGSLTQQGYECSGVSLQSDRRGVLVS